MANDREQSEHVGGDDGAAEKPIQEELEQVEPARRQLILFMLLFVLCGALPNQFAGGGVVVEVVQRKSLVQRHASC